MKIKFIDYKNTLYWLLIMLSIGLYNDAFKLTKQHKHAYFDYNHKNTNIDWTKAIVLSKTSPGRILRVPVVKKIVKKTWILKEHVKKTLLEIIRKLFMLYQFLRYHFLLSKGRIKHYQNFTNSIENKDRRIDRLSEGIINLL